MRESSVCQYLPWDSDFFGFRIARVVGTELNPIKISNVLDWCASEDINCLYFLANGEDGTSVRFAEDNGFHLVDIRHTLERDLTRPALNEGGEVPVQIRPSRPEDIPTLKAIARVGFRITRFYYDQNFPRQLCDALYEIWVEKSCQDPADTVLVAEHEGKIAGFITCKLHGNGKGEIGLVGVGTGWQGLGLGRELLNCSLSWFQEQGVTHVTVVTQGRNSKAQRLYQRCGFVTQAIHLWYHKWFSLIPKSA